MELQYDNRLRSIWSALQQSQLVITKHVNDYNINEFTSILGRLLPISPTDRITWELIRFMFMRNQSEFFKYVNTIGLQHVIMLVGGNALATELKIRDIVSIQLNRDKTRFNVFACVPWDSISDLGRLSAPKNPQNTSDQSLTKQAWPEIKQIYTNKTANIITSGQPQSSPKPQVTNQILNQSPAQQTGSIPRNAPTPTNNTRAKRGRDRKPRRSDKQKSIVGQLKVDKSTSKMNGPTPNQILRRTRNEAKGLPIIPPISPVVHENMIRSRVLVQQTTAQSAPRATYRLVCPDTTVPELQPTVESCPTGPSPVLDTIPETVTTSDVATPNDIIANIPPVLNWADENSE